MSTRFANHVIFVSGQLAEVMSQRPLCRFVNTPFEKVAVDLVGPINPVTETENRSILTTVHFATRYPEAIAVANIDTETIA